MWFGGPPRGLPVDSRLAQLSGVDIPLFMTSRVPSRPGPRMDTSIFSMRGYRALCLACSLEKTALRWLRPPGAGARADPAAAAAAVAKPVDAEESGGGCHGNVVRVTTSD